MLLPLLRSDGGFAVAIIMHRPAVENDSSLELVLGAGSSIPVTKAKHFEPILAGRAVVCPADVHLTVDDGRYILTTGPKENHCRPSIDVTFRSVAETFGERGCGVVLSGLLDDGSAGTAALRNSGALTIALDPHEALFGDMPSHAIKAGAETVASLEEIARHLAAFGRRRIPRLRAGSSAHRRGEKLTRYTCPDCHGVLAEDIEGRHVFYRCRVGHAYSPETLDQEKEVAVEEAMWAAVQVLEEQADLTMRAAENAREKGRDKVAKRLETRAQNHRVRAETVRTALPSVDDALKDSNLRDAVV